MFGLLESLLIGIIIGSICGGCIGICLSIIKYYNDSNIHKMDVENITKNILHISDEETGSKVEYMTARPIV
jgi:hypothetical protein